MGCCCSSLPKFDILTNRTLQELGLTRGETKKLVTLFGRVDLDGNGVIQADEFFDFFALHPTLVNKLIFSCYDLEENGEMTFIQFVCTLWSFFTLKPEEMGLFVFFVFDLDKSGEMPYSQITHMAKQIHKKHFDESPALKALVSKGVKMGKGDGGKNMPPLTAETFTTWSGANADMCRPIVGKQRDMMEKAYRASFWKKISLKKYKATRLSDVHYICNFMKRVRGQREVPKKILSAEEQAVRDQQAAAAAKIDAEAADKAEKVKKHKKKQAARSSAGHETKEGHQVSYFDIDDIDHLMDNYAVGADEMKGLKKKSVEAPKKTGGGGKNKKGTKHGKNKKPGSSTDTNFASLTTTKELPPLVLKALQKGNLSAATIAPMDNNRISDAAREKVRIEKANENLSPEEKKRIFAVKAARLNKKMSNEYDIFN